MAGRYSPPPHPHPERSSSFNPLAHLLSHLADSPPTSPAVFTSIDLGHPDTHDPEDILREIRTDGDNPFPIDRNVLKSVVAKRMRTQVTRITFLSSDMRAKFIIDITFLQAFLVTLADEREIVARIARRYMPKLKTESEVRDGASRALLLFRAVFNQARVASAGRDNQLYSATHRHPRPGHLSFRYQPI
ncbi:hypothetical protein FRB94_008635 [Tulasnella sp. JGI-2019a]|nr:hypothetical protein FRB94_008635 [Tulasnella sp. JGI-2019a]